MGGALLPRLWNLGPDHAQGTCRLAAGDLRIEPVFSAVLYPRRRNRRAQAFLARVVGGPWNFSARRCRPPRRLAERYYLATVGYKALRQPSRPKTWPSLQLSHQGPPEPDKK